MLGLKVRNKRLYVNIYKYTGINKYVYAYNKKLPVAQYMHDSRNLYPKNGSGRTSDYAKKMLRLRRLTGTRLGLPTRCAHVLI